VTPWSEKCKLTWRKNGLKSMQSLQANPTEIAYLSGRTIAIITDAILNL